MKIEGYLDWRKNKFKDRKAPKRSKPSRPLKSRVIELEESEEEKIQPESGVFLKPVYDEIHSHLPISPGDGYLRSLSKKDAIRKLQAVLNIGFESGLKIDGNYGPITHSVMSGIGQGSGSNEIDSDYIISILNQAKGSGIDPDHMLNLVLSASRNPDQGSFELPDLPYPYGALEPYIDTMTMEIHHTKHHKGYTDKLNDAIKKDPHLPGQTIDHLLKNHSDIPEIRENGGGFYNHSLFWQIMGPAGGGTPTGDLAQAIDRAFGTFEGFKEAFSKAAATQFGSGWAWLCVHPGGELEVCSSANQDNPLMPGVGCDGFPILGLDVWEHAYYLKYQNRRQDYIDAFFNVINWNKVSELYSIGSMVI